MKNKKIVTILLALIMFFSSPMTVSVAASDVNMYEVVKNDEIFAQDGIVYKIEYVNYYNMFTEEEIKMLQKVTMAEAGNQSKECQLMVATTVLNRVKSNLFPNTIKEVIFEKNNNGLYQFSCVEDGNYAKAIPTEKVILTVEEALFNYANGIYIYPEDMLYFNSIGYFSWANDYQKVGAMYFSLQDEKQ